MPHPPVRQLLLEAVPGVLEARARRLQVIDADAHMTKTAVGLDVAVVDLVVGVGLGAVVVRELDEALAVPEGAAGGGGVGGVVAEEVEVELGVGEGEGAQEGEAEEGVEFHWGVGVRFSAGGGGERGKVPDSLGSLTRSLGGGLAGEGRGCWMGERTWCG